MGEREYSIRIVEVIRGDEAWDRVYAANQFNDPPLKGMDYVLVYAVVDLLSSTAEGPVHVFLCDWQALSGGRLWQVASAFTPEPEFGGVIFPGQTMEGWVLLQVKQTDPEPLLAWHINFYDGTGGVWFSLAD